MVDISVFAQIQFLLLVHWLIKWIANFLKNEIVSLDWLREYPSYFKYLVWASFSLFGLILSASGGAGFCGVWWLTPSGSGRGPTLSRFDDFLLRKKSLSATQGREVFSALSGDCGPRLLKYEMAAVAAAAAGSRPGLLGQLTQELV